MGRGSRQSGGGVVVVKLHDSYFAYNENIWQDICLELGMWIAKTPVKIACFYDF